MVKILLVVIVVIITLSNFGIDIAPLVALGGAAAFGICFAVQGPIANYGTGLVIILTRPFLVGDTVLAGRLGRGRRSHACPCRADW